MSTGELAAFEEWNRLYGSFANQQAKDQKAPNPSATNSPGLSENARERAGGGKSA